MLSPQNFPAAQQRKTSLPLDRSNYPRSPPVKRLSNLSSRGELLQRAVLNTSKANLESEDELRRNLDQTTTTTIIIIIIIIITVPVVYCE